MDNSRGAGAEAGSEPDYLAGAQPEENPFDFRQVVREAFLLEHGCRYDKEIAALLGVDKSRISQIYKDAKVLEAESIDRLLTHLTSAHHRSRIVRAWSIARFSVDPADRRFGRRTTQSSEKTLRRIDRQIREMRLDTAVRTAAEALHRSTDQVLTEQLTDRCFFLYQRLDEPGRALSVARGIAERATGQKNTRRLVAAHLFRIRALLSLADVTPGEVMPLFDDASKILSQAPPLPSPLPPYTLGDEHKLSALRLSAEVTFAEREQVTIDKAMFRAALAAAQTRAKSKGPKQSTYAALQLAARIHLLLGETFQAGELLERAYATGGLSHLNTFEMCGVIEGRIRRETESPTDALEYLRGVRSLCYRSSDRYHQRLAEYDIARLENSLFPTCKR